LFRYFERAYAHAFVSLFWMWIRAHICFVILNVHTRTPLFRQFECLYSYAFVSFAENRSNDEMMRQISGRSKLRRDTIRRLSRQCRYYGMHRWRNAETRHARKQGKSYSVWQIYQHKNKTHTTHRFAKSAGVRQSISMKRQYTRHTSAEKGSRRVSSWAAQNW
jgi:hypothetical protein